MASLKQVAYNAWTRGQLPQFLIQLWCGSSLSITFLICISHLMWILEPKWNHQSCKVWHFSWPRFCVTFKSKITLLVSDSQISESQGQGLSFLRFQSINALRFATDHKNTKVPQFLSFLSQESIQLPFLAGSKWQTVWQWKKFSPLVNLQNFPTKRNKAISSRAIIPIWRR